MKSYLIQLIAYIHLNPMKHGFVEDFTRYRYSSYQAYMSKKPTRVDTAYIYSLIDREEFENWHQEKKMNSKYLIDFLGNQT